MAGWGKVLRVQSSSHTERREKALSNAGSGLRRDQRFLVTFFSSLLAFLGPLKMFEEGEKIPEHR